MVGVKSKEGSFGDVDVVIEDDFDGLIVDKAAKALMEFFILFLFIDSSNVMLNKRKCTTSLTLRSRSS